jgi:hypothetical protein
MEATPNEMPVTATVQARQRWEYNYLPASAKFSELDEFGADGWEMVAVTALGGFYFKRPTIKINAREVKAVE